MFNKGSVVNWFVHDTVWSCANKSPNQYSATSSLPSPLLSGCEVHILPVWCLHPAGGFTNAEHHGGVWLARLLHCHIQVPRLPGVHQHPKNYCWQQVGLVTLLLLIHYLGRMLKTELKLRTPINCQGKTIDTMTATRMLATTLKQVKVYFYSTLKTAIISSTISAINMKSNQNIKNPNKMYQWFSIIKYKISFFNYD